MTKKIFCFLFSALLILALAGVVAAEDTVTPDEVIAKVEEAVAYLSEKGEAGLADFNNPEGPWVWGGTYVFVFNCDEGIIAAHPNNDLIGIELGSRIDEKGNRYNLDLCEVSKNPKGGWVEYWRPTDSMDAEGGAMYRRKISYILKVPGQPYEVGAGIYEPTMTLEELNALLE
jgi:hypothetical protein